MREMKFLAGLGTILIFIGIYCFKALRQKSSFKEDIHVPKKSASTNSTKIILILAGIISIALGLFLIIKALKLL